MTAISYVSPKGFPEYLPETQRLFTNLKNTVQKSFELYGFEYIETPAVEYLHTLASEGDITKEIYAITRAKSEVDNTGSDRGLRFDLTTPFARYVAQHQGHLTFPFKRYQIDRVWRGERPQKGRYRELYQADVDVVAKDNLPLAYDGQVLGVIASTLDNMDLFDFTIRINNREFLGKYIQTLGVSAECIKPAFNIIDKLAKVSREVSLNRLQEECQLEASVAEKFLDEVSKTYSISEVAAITKDFDYLQETVANLNLRRGKIIIDLSIVRGLDYYTGFVYETTINGHESYGSISSGGRYDNLATRFSKQSFPGVGGSIGLSRLFFILNEEKLLTGTKPRSGVYVMLMDESRQEASHKLAANLRAVEIRSEASLEVAKFGKQIQYADGKGYEFVAIIEEEGAITLKNLKTREQKGFTKESVLINELKNCD